MRILITGAAGNLGSLLNGHLLPSDHELNLLIHNKELPKEVRSHPNVSVYKADLRDPDTLYAACKGVDCVVHLAGILFAPRPERFLPITNIEYVKNLVAVALKSDVRKLILISFPHVEGESTPEQPAQGLLTGTGKPDSIHAQTRLSAEKYLFKQTDGTDLVPVVLRPGMIYGRGILMIEAARWLLKRRLFGVWRRPTWIHLLSQPDFLACTVAAIEGINISGIYNLGDDHPMTLQEFVDKIAVHWGFRKPWRGPQWIFPLTGGLTEVVALLLNKPAPLTRDFIKIGMADYVSDTSRMQSDLLPKLAYPSLQSGLNLL